MLITPYGPQGDIFAHQMGFGGLILYLLLVIGMFLAAGMVVWGQKRHIKAFVAVGAVGGLAVAFAIVPLLLVAAQNPTEQFYEVQNTPVKGIGKVVKPDILSYGGDDTAREVAYEDNGRQYKQLVATDNIKLSDYGDPTKSLNGVTRGTIKAKVVLKPRYRPYAKQIEREFKPDRDKLVNIDDTTVHLERPTKLHHLD